MFRKFVHYSYLEYVLLVCGILCLAYADTLSKWVVLMLKRTKGSVITESRQAVPVVDLNEFTGTFGLLSFLLLLAAVGVGCFHWWESKCKTK